MIGGKEQKHLDTIRMTPGMSVDSLINYYPIRFDSITGDGEAILKMYFIDPSTGTYAGIDGTVWDWGIIPFTDWPKPFKDPITGAYTDEYVIKFYIYNKPKFESDIISQIVSNGKLRLDHLSGTPLKYMMRSINGLGWRPATAPLSEIEQMAVGDDVSICLRELDKTIAYQDLLVDFYLSDRFNPMSNEGNGFGMFGELLDKYMNIYYQEAFDTYYRTDYYWDNDVPAGHTWANFTFDGVVFLNNMQEWYDYILSEEFGDHNIAVQMVVGAWEYELAGGYNSALSTALSTLYDDAIAAVYDYWPILQQEMSDKVSTTESCREVIYLKFESFTTPVLQRSVEINTIPGVTSNPMAGTKHYVKSHEDFPFTLDFSGGQPLKVTVTGLYSQLTEELTGEKLGDGLYRYTIRRVVEPKTVTVSSTPASGVDVDNEIITGKRVWTHGNTLYINSDKADRVNIYTLSGTLHKQLNAPTGLTTEQLERGLYIVEIDGARYKVAVK
jgi:hypothetical protein